jgi:hypothetical protein
MRRVVPFLAVIALVCPAACADAPAKKEARATASAAATTRDPDAFSVRPVLRESAPPCDETRSDVLAETIDGKVTGCLHMGDVAFSSNDIASAELAWDQLAQGDQAIVVITLTQDAGERFKTFTGEHVQQRVALVSHGALLSAPTIVEPMEAGHMQIQVVSVAEGQRLVGELGGDPTKLPSKPPDTPMSLAAERAKRICDRHRPPNASADPMSLTGATSTGSITAQAKQLLGHVVPPWDTLPADHFVAQCSYGGFGSPTTFVDEEGRSTEDPFSEIGAPSTP